MHIIHHTHHICTLHIHSTTYIPHIFCHIPHTLYTIPHTLYVTYDTPHRPHILHTTDAHTQCSIGCSPYVSSACCPASGPPLVLGAAGPLPHCGHHRQPGSLHSYTLYWAQGRRHGYEVKVGQGPEQWASPQNLQAVPTFRWRRCGSACSKTQGQVLPPAWPSLSAGPLPTGEVLKPACDSSAEQGLWEPWQGAQGGPHC